jgi:hypothetical protein
MDALGNASVYFDGAYDVTLKTSADVTVWGPQRLETPEPAGTSAVLRADLADSSGASNGDALIAEKRTTSGAIATTRHASLENEPFNAKGTFGVLFDNATDNQSTLVSAFASPRDLYLIEGVARFSTGNLSPTTRTKITGAGRELTYLRTTHASNPAIASTAQLVTYEGFTVDRSGAVAGKGIQHAGVNNATPLEGFVLNRVNVAGHATGVELKDFVIAALSDSYLQSNTVGLSCSKTGANFCTLLSVVRCWIRANTTTAALIDSVKNTYFEQTAFEGSGAGTDTGLSISGGGVHRVENCWWEDVNLAGTFVGCGSVSLNGGYLNGASLTAHAFYAASSGGNNPTVIFDGAWEVQNLSGTFAIADATATIIVRSPALLGLTFSAINGGKVIFDVPLEAKATYDPPNTASLAQAAATTVTVTGAGVGDICTASFENATSDPQSFDISAFCFSSDTVTVRMFNRHSAAIDMASGTLSVRVQKRALIS